MRRFQLFEIADQKWCPRFICRAVTAFLATVASRTRIYLPTGDFLKKALERTKASAIVVLCAGSGGGIVDVAGALSPETKITLTDLAPDTSFSSRSSNMVYDPRPVDARNMPPDLKGATVVYGSFHHFPPQVNGTLGHCWDLIRNASHIWLGPRTRLKCVRR